ncbi:MAG: hypothetical protein ACE5FN_11870 [Leptospirillia bacterium]
MSLTPAGSGSFAVDLGDGLPPRQVDYTPTQVTVSGLWHSELYMNPLDNVAPTLTVPGPLTVEATGVLTSVAIGVATAVDTTDPAPTITNDAPDAFPLGTTVVTWTAIDSAGNVATAGQLVTVQDTTAPMVTAPAEAIVEATGDATSVALGATTATDAVGVVDIWNDAPAAFAVYPAAWADNPNTVTGGKVNTTLVTWSADDAAGNVGTAIQTVTVHNTAPSAEPGVTFSQNACLSMTCDVTLDGSASSDMNSTATFDDITAFDWYENYDVATHTGSHLGSGQVLTVSLGLTNMDPAPQGHRITLVATDSAGNVTESAEIAVKVDPAQLSLFDLKKAEVELHSGKIKLHGVLAPPVGKLFGELAPAGGAILDLPGLGINIGQYVSFATNGSGTKWEYKGGTGGIIRFKINWEGERMRYVGGLDIKTEHMGTDATTLEIEPGTLTGAYQVGLNAYTLTMNADGSPTVSGGTVDVDDDGEVEWELPFALTPTMQVVIGAPDAAGTMAPVESFVVGDQITPAVGKFQLNAEFDPTTVDGISITDRTLDVTVMIGTEAFPGHAVIDMPVSGNDDSGHEKEWKRKEKR